MKVDILQWRAHDLVVDSLSFLVKSMKTILDSIRLHLNVVGIYGLIFGPIVLLFFVDEFEFERWLFTPSLSVDGPSKSEMLFFLLSCKNTNN